MANKGNKYGAGEGVYGMGCSPSGDVGVAGHCMGKGKGHSLAAAGLKGWDSMGVEWGQGWGPTIGKGWHPAVGKGWSMDMGIGSARWYPMGLTGEGGRPCWQTLPTGHRS